MEHQVGNQSLIPTSLTTLSAVVNQEETLSSSYHNAINKGHDLSSISYIPVSYQQSPSQMLSQAALSNTIANPAVPSSTGEASVMSMPVAMPLSGLATIPLALCAMGGAENTGGANVVQTGAGVAVQPGMPAGGIVLLNIPGNNNANLAALSQLVACGNQVQPTPQAMVHPMMVGGNGCAVNAQTAVQMQQQNHAQQTAHPVSAPTVASINQAQMQPPTAPQGGAAAYMLVPIPQSPSSNQVSQMQQITPAQPTVLQAQYPAFVSLANHTSAGGSSFTTRTPYHIHSSTTQLTQPAATHTNYTNQRQVGSFSNLASSGMEISTVTPQTACQISVTNEMSTGQAPPSTTTPINDPHISSSVPTPYKDLPSFLTPTLLKEIQKLYKKKDLGDLNEKELSGELANQILKTLSSKKSTPQPSQSTTHEHKASTQSLLQPEGELSVPVTITEAVNKPDDVVIQPTVSQPFLSPSPGTSQQQSNVPSITTVLPQSPLNAQVPAGPATKSVPNSPEVQPAREKRKKGPAPKLDGNEECLVCTDKASGYHYGVLSCEGCKGFFRRSIIKNSVYKCKEKGDCKMDSYTRRKCQYCRLAKCRQAGMKDETVLSEVSGGSKAKRIKREQFSPSPRHFAPNLSPNGQPVPSLTSHQRNLVEMLQANEVRYQWPTQEDVEKVTPAFKLIKAHLEVSLFCSRIIVMVRKVYDDNKQQPRLTVDTLIFQPWVESGDSHRCRASRFAHFTELAILIVQLVVEFTKQLPGFLKVTREDQILLLKACTIEVMLLRAAKQYDKRSKAINFLNGKYYDKSSFYRAGMQVEFVDPIFDFCDSMAKLGLDEAEFALLVAINTFSADRPNLKDLKNVESIQDSYVELLRVYLKIHHPDDPLMFARTLMKLVELRTLNNYHSEQIFALKVQDKQLPPLLAEIWDM